jgi:sulfate permease, SulP family
MSREKQIRTIFKEAFASVGLPYFNPHSFRKTLALLGGQMCKSPEEYKAWSQNLGHENVLTTLSSYGNPPPRGAAPENRVIRLRSQALRSIGGGLVASLLSLAYAFSYAALIFTGPLKPFLGQGVAAALITAAVTATLVALTSSFRLAVAGPDSNTAALLATMMVVLAPAMSVMRPDQALALALAGLAAATLLTGLSLFLLGWRRLGRLVRFAPYPVVAGFLAATGVLMLLAAVRMAVDLPLSLPSLPLFSEPRTFALLAITMLWAAALWWMTSRFESSLVLPLALVGATFATHVVLALFGVTDDVLSSSGLMFAAQADSRPLVPLLAGNLTAADWKALQPVVGDIAAVAVLGILSILLNSTAIELATGIDADLDRELRTQGLANVASALAGGFVGHISVSRTLVNRAAGSATRLSGVVVGLVAFATLFASGEVITYMPRFVLGGLLFYLGAKLVWDWGIVSRRSLPLRDWFVVLAIVFIATWLGLMEALLFGMLASCIIFAVDVSRIGIIRHQFGLHERPSSVLRSSEENAFLAQNGGQVQILQLSGYLFFGSTYSLQEKVASVVANIRPAEIIFDFSRVTGIDSTAGASFAKIRGILHKSRTRQVMVAMPPAAVAIVRASPGLDDNIACHNNLDTALEQAEEALLEKCVTAHRPERPLLEWLAEIVGSHESARELHGHLKPAKHKSDSYLCRQGDPTDSLIFVERGPISVILEGHDVSPLRVRVFGDHTLVGEIGFFLNAPRSASLLAGPDALAWALSRDAFDMFMNERPEQALALAVYVIRLQSERLTFANRWITSLQR